ncbi:MAG: hypothetical protein JWM27_4731 [Gemmatimonadetes bacterium]|nr:hypothetical protein [Gemmatimonadota bacterium]
MSEAERDAVTHLLLAQREQINAILALLHPAPEPAPAEAPRPAPRVLGGNRNPGATG